MAVKEGPFSPASWRVIFDGMSDIEPTRRPFQYSLWSLFVLTTFVAVLCSMGVCCTDWSVPIVLVVGIGVSLVRLWPAFSAETSHGRNCLRGGGLPRQAGGPGDHRLWTYPMAYESDMAVDSCTSRVQPAPSTTAGTCPLNHSPGKMARGIHPGRARGWRGTTTAKSPKVVRSCGPDLHHPQLPSP